MYEFGGFSDFSLKFLLTLLTPGGPQKAPRSKLMTQAEQVYDSSEDNWKSPSDVAKPHFALRVIQLLRLRRVLDEQGCS